MSKANFIDFTSRDCKESSHDECHVSWQGLGYEVVCNCACHKKDDKSHQEKICSAVMPDEGYQKNVPRRDAREVKIKGTGGLAQHQRNESFSSHPCNPAR